MAQSSRDAEQLRAWIDRLQAGDPAARGELVGHACDQLRRLTRKMLKDYERIKRWEETDDVLQNSLLRLWSALEKVTPRSAREFYGLAALQIRRELVDLARQYYGPEGLGARHQSHAGASDSQSTPPALANNPDTTHDPSRLALWSEFHQRVEALPVEEREVFDLLWYQEFTQAEASAILGISEATLKRRWLSARRRLHQLLKGALPGF